MTMKLSGIKGMTNYENGKKEFIEAVKNKVGEDIQNEKYLAMIDGLANDLMSQAKKEARLEADEYITASKLDNAMTPEEVKFFNEVNTETGWKEEALLPETVVDKIFEDLATEHPLLNALGLKYSGLRLKILKSDPKGAVVWGKIFSEIQGQLDAAFSEEDATQSKATAFVVIPNDLSEYGPVWIKRYVTIQIKEAFAVALESAFLTGDGKDKPIGLNRQVQEGVSVSGGVYPEKEVTGKLTFKDEVTSIQEMKNMIKHHSVKENGKRVSVRGKINLVASPEDALDIEANFTSRNAMGDYITKMPFNVNIIESEFQETGKVLSFVAGRYTAVTAGELTIKEFDQTLALEDCTLYTAKQFAYGKADDDKVAAVWELAKPEKLPEG